LIRAPREVIVRRRFAKQRPTALEQSISRILRVSWRPPTWFLTLAVCAGAADSVLSAFSRPFRWSADLTTGVALAGVVLIGVASMRLERSRGVPIDVPAPTAPGRSGMLAWGVLASASLIFELGNFFAKPRSSHPTMSSLLDALTGHEVLRGLLFAAWLCAGWWLLRTT
jgi:hypothetical protein